MKKKFNRFTQSRIDILTFPFLRSCIIVPKPVNNVIFYIFSLPIIIIIKYSVFFVQKEREKNNNTENLVS